MNGGFKSQEEECGSHVFTEGVLVLFDGNINFQWSVIQR